MFSLIRLMNEVIDQFGQLTTKELVSLTRQPHSLWTLTARKHGVLNDLLAGKVIATDHQIDFSILIDDEGRQRYADCLEYLEMAKSLK